MRTMVLASLVTLLLGVGRQPALAQEAGSHRGAPSGGANFDLQDAPLGSTLDLITQWADVKFAIDPADMDQTTRLHSNSTMRRCRRY